MFPVTLLWTLYGDSATILPLTSFWIYLRHLQFSPVSGQRHLKSWNDQGQTINSLKVRTQTGLKDVSTKTSNNFSLSNLAKSILSSFKHLKHHSNTITVHWKIIMQSSLKAKISHSGVIFHLIIEINLTFIYLCMCLVFPFFTEHPRFKCHLVELLHGVGSIY